MATLFLMAHPQLLLHPDKLLNPNLEDREKMDRLCAFLGNAEGRDKIAKLVQFAARFLDGFFREGPGQMIVGDSMLLYCDQLRALWNGLQTARCWSWMGKSLIEWRTDIQTFENKTLTKEVKALHMACRFFFAGRWFFENFMLLVQSKVLRDTTKGGWWAPAADLNRYAKRSWLIALLFGIATECAKLRLIKNKYDELESGRNKKPQKEYDGEIAKVKDDFWLRMRTIFMMVCDSPVSISVGLGYGLSHTKIGFMMTLSSIIQCQNIYPK